MSQPRIPGDLGQAVRTVASTTNTTPELSSGSEAFSSYMQKSVETSAANGAKPSPISLAQAAQKPPITPQSLLSQVNLMQKAMTELQGQMMQPHLKLKSSQKYLLKNKLSSINSGMLAVNAKIEGALDKEGSEKGQQGEMESSPESKSGKKISGPMGQFLHYMTDGVKQLETVKKELASLGDKGASIAPGDFLFIQLKLAKAQQEMEFSSALLTKASEGMKTIMNIQL